jgi:single-strand DNA-binding protein
MAEGLNRVMLLGNIGQQPELRYTQSNQAVLSLRMATNERFKNRDGEWQDRTEWHSVVVWGRRAEGLNRVLSKGSPLFVEGRLQTRSWEDRQGQKRYTTEIVAREVLLVGGRRGAGEMSDAGPPPPSDDDYASAGASAAGTGGGGGYDGQGAGGGDFSDDDIPF